MNRSEHEPQDAYAYSQSIGSGLVLQHLCCDFMPTAEEDKAITAAVRSDPDAQPLTPKQLKSMAPIQALHDFAKNTDRKFNRMRPSMSRVWLPKHPSKHPSHPEV
jgi:hypothetical protein